MLLQLHIAREGSLSRAASCAYTAENWQFCQDVRNTLACFSSYRHKRFSKITFSVLQYLVGSAQLCLLRRCHSVYVSCQCFTDSVVSTPLSNFVPICWHLDIHVRVVRMGIRRQSILAQGSSLVCRTSACSPLSAKINAGRSGLPGVYASREDQGRNRSDYLGVRAG